MGDGMTTLLDSTCSDRSCTSAANDLPKLSVYSELSHSGETTVSAKVGGVLDYDEEIIESHYSPPPFRTPTKDASSPGSSELPSMPSEKSNSRGCSIEGSSGCFPVSNEITDTERSVSDSSMSPNAQRVEGSSCNGLVSPSLLRLEDTIDSVLEKLGEQTYQPSSYTNPSVVCQPSSDIPITSTSTFQFGSSSIHRTTEIQVCSPMNRSYYAFIPPLSYSTPVCTDFSQLFHENESQQRLSTSNYDHWSIHGQQMTAVDPGSSPFPDNRKRPPSSTSSYRETLAPHVKRVAFDSTMPPHDGPLNCGMISPPYYPRHAYRLNNWNGLSSDCATVGYSYSDQYLYRFPIGQSKGYSYSPTGQQRKMYTNRSCRRYVNSLDFYWKRDCPCSVAPIYGNNCYPLSLKSTRSMKGSEDSPKPSGTSVCGAPTRPFITSTCVSSSSEPTSCCSTDSNLSAETVFLPAHTCSPQTNVVPRRAACGSVSPNSCMISGQADPPVGVALDAEGNKRRLQQSSSPRVSKRRRISEEDKPGTSSSWNPRDNLIKSVLLGSPFKCSQNPVVSLPLTLCPPSPVPCSQSVSSISLFSDEDNLLASHGKKYFEYPFCLHPPSPHRPDDLQLFNLLSKRSTESDQSKELIHKNLFTEALRRASSRSAQSSTYLSPPSPETSLSSALSLLELMPSCSTNPIGRVTPTLATRHFKHIPQVEGKSDSAYQQRTSPPYRELVISSDILTTPRPITCTYCRMQIVASEDAIDWRPPDGDGRLLFCSSSCLNAYQRSATSDESKRNLCSTSAGTSVLTASLLTADERYSLPVLLQRNLNLRTARGLGRRSLPYDHKAVRSRCSADSNTPLHDLLGRRGNYWRWNPSRWRRFHSTTRPIKQTDPRKSDSSTSNQPVSSSFCQQARLLTSSGDQVVTVGTSATDERTCLLCHKRGDAPNHIAGRLLNFDFDRWVHLNCMLWCFETYETVSGSLMNAQQSLAKAERTICSHCNLNGAGLPCFHSDCLAIYHLPCAYAIGCIFHADRGMYCPVHRSSSNSSKSPVLDSLIVERRVFVGRDEDEQVANAILQADHSAEGSSKKSGESAALRVGAIILNEVGQLLPEQLASGLFHNANFIYPVGFSSTRFYWSYRHVKRRCRYHCRIEDKPYVANEATDDLPVSCNTCAKFVVEVDEPGETRDVFEDSTCNGVWQQILSRINALREASPKCGYLRVFEAHLRGEVLFGLTEPHIIRAIESLPGVDRLTGYAFKFGRLQLIKEMPLAVNPTGCARSEPKLRTHVRRWLANENVDVPVSTHRIPNAYYTCTPLRSTRTIPIYATTSSASFSKSQQYRKLRVEWRLNVILARSKIQGTGLYAARTINKHCFIIEYLGELIRNEVGNRREQLYESQNRGVYMFRVDDDCIVDATMCGGLARYINHSCDPNCTAEVLNCDNGSHIIIIAKRNIVKGEELTYDYKFDIEEDRWDRIPCLCGASNCRKWMN